MSALIELPPQDTERIGQPLSTALEASIQRGVDLDRALAALALLDPGGCLEFLADDDSGMLAKLSDRARSQAILSALPSVAEASDVSERLIVRFGAALSAEAVAALAAKMGRHPRPEALDLLANKLHAAPRDARLLRAALTIAERANEFSKADALLTQLGLAERTPATVAAVQRARKRLPIERVANVRIALIGSYTVDGLVPFVDLECRSLGLNPDIYVTPFNSWTRAVIDPASELRRFAADVAFLAVSIDDLIPGLAEPLSARQLADLGAEALNRTLSVVESYTHWAAGKPLIVHSFHTAFAQGPLGISDGASGPSRRRWLAELNGQLASALEVLPRVHLLDVEDAVARGGASLVDDPKMRHLAAMRLPPSSCGAVAKAYANYIAPVAGLTRKCVVLDLDNTLWGGIVGEDGPDGILLGETAPGSEFVEFQGFLRGLRERGLLLAINSKNNPEDALAVLRTHDRMLLRESDFSAVRINWAPKAENMVEIARELNIGLDSLVFVDDNPSERERMRALLPEVLTVDLPKDTSLYRATLEALPQLQVLEVTSEDRGRADAYAMARLREEARSSTGSVDDYLHSLRIEVSIAQAEPAAYARVAQLFARTNQFNVTTKRHDQNAVERFSANPEWQLLTLRARDRFGDHGLVALALAKVEAERWDIDSLLMSCRVIGYGIESALLNELAERARAAGASSLSGSFVPSKKNAPAQDLFARHGFVMESDRDGEQHWKLDLAKHTPPAPPWIART